VDPLLEFALAIKAGQRFFERMANEAMRPLGVTGAQADALTVIGQAGPLSLKELGDLLIAEAGHPSRMVDRLVEAGLVERKAASEDRRRVVLQLTADGRRLERKVEARRAEVLDAGRQLLGSLDIEEVMPLVRQLLAVTPYSDLIERRRELAESATGKKAA
jgi:DNA-binding MarR family transcriptional regulator